MKNSILALLIISVLAVACSNERETVSGQKFTVVRKGDGKEVSVDKYLLLNFSYKDAKDSVWGESAKSPYPLVLYKRQINTPGDPLLEVVCMLTKGDSAVFKISAYDLFMKSFRQRMLPRKVDSASQFTFNFGVINVMDSAEHNQFQKDMVAKQNEKILKQMNEQLAKDTVLIDSFLKEKNMTAKKTASGIRYIVTKAGLGNNAKDGQTVKVNYAGHLMNGTYFDTSLESVAKEQKLHQEGRPYGPISVTLGTQGVIPGWEETLKLMNKGSKLTVFIPSTLAYGPRRNGAIPENSVLVFDMELTDLK